MLSALFSPAIIGTIGAAASVVKGRSQRNEIRRDKMNALDQVEKAISNDVGRAAAQGVSIDRQFVSSLYSSDIENIRRQSGKAQSQNFSNTFKNAGEVISPFLWG